MSVKASVSLSEQQEAFVRRLVAEGRFSSVSAVVQHGLELLCAKTERDEAELQALRVFFQERRNGEFEGMAEAREATREMIKTKRVARGL